MPDDLEKELQRLELEKRRAELHELTRERRIPAPLRPGYVGLYLSVLGSIVAFLTLLLPYRDALKKQEREDIAQLIARLERHEEVHYATKALSEYGKKAIRPLKKTYDRHTDPKVLKPKGAKGKTPETVPAGKLTPSSIDVVQAPLGSTRRGVLPLTLRSPHPPDSGCFPTRSPHSPRPP
jgi:hypothetical protein